MSNPPNSTEGADGLVRSMLKKLPFAAPESIAGLVEDCIRSAYSRGRHDVLEALPPPAATQAKETR